MNDEEIFTKRFLPLYKNMYSVATAILGSGSDEASDAVQDAMVKIWKSRHTLAEVANPEGFAIAIVRTSAIDILNRRRHWSDIDECTEVSADPPPELDSAEWIEKIIASLPPGQQEVVRMSAFANLSNEEISKITGFSSVNVRQLLSRGRKRIKELYSKLL